ncbi:MAG: hypothetical protein LBC28_01395 [Oscillospiraceae bacterium]|nr:hypothetical protein [Oscillospiraceae bacterium]
MSAKAKRRGFFARRIIPAAACLAIAAGLLLGCSAAEPNAPSPLTGGETDASAAENVIAGGADMTGGASDAGFTADIGKPTLKINTPEMETVACYAAPDDWRGLPAEDFVLEEQTEDGAAADRLGLRTLRDLADRADMFIVVPRVHETAPDGDNMQSAIAEYAETIGDALVTHQWDEGAVSTGDRVLIRQMLIGGCTMDEPNNLLRAGGVYLLPISFHSYWGAFEIVGDLDVLFELDDEGKIVSHSRWPEYSGYDGKPFSELLNDVRALYPAPTGFSADFAKQPIDTFEQAEAQVNAAYRYSGFRVFSAEFEKETVVKGADAYLFRVSFGAEGKNGAEYAAIAKKNGAFIGGDLDENGELKTRRGLGSFPKEGQ